MDAIRRWFVEHEDGDFAIAPPGHPYFVVPPSTSSSNIVYTTKPQCLLAPFAGAAAEPSFGVVGRYGLPGEREIGWLRTATNGRQVRFVGDADPCDLLIFTWLSSRMPISYHGLNDLLLKKCNVLVNDRLQSVQSASETAAMKFLTEQLPNFHELLGSDCAAVLASGRKIEIEALVSFATNTPTEFAAALAG